MAHQQSSTRHKTFVFLDGSDGGIHSLHKRHIASTEPVPTSARSAISFFLGGALTMVATQVFQLVVCTLTRIHGAPSVITT